MLSQVVLASYGEIEDDGIHHGQLTVTGISPCPYGTYINYHKLDKDDPPTGSDILRMSNGHWQEDECVENLRHAGYKIRFTGKEQMTLHIGKTSVTGRPDGLITVNGHEDVLSIKAMNGMRYNKFKSKGLEAEPFIKSQEQLYLASEELKNTMAGTWIYAKHKDSCAPFDLYEPKDLAWSKPLIEALEAITLGNEVVKRPQSIIPLCSHCRHSTFCWKEEAFTVDMSGTKVLSLPEATAKWHEAKFHQDYGDELMKDVRVVFQEALGDKDLLLADDLRIKKIVSTRSGISEKKFIKKYGVAALAEVMESKEISFMRITEVVE